MGVIVRLHLMARMLVIMMAVVSDMLMIVHIPPSFMRVLMKMFMHVLMGVFVGMLVAVRLAVMRMLVRVCMSMLMGMQMFVFVFSFHKQSSCPTSSGCQGSS
ncbi:MAG: hypothetical protein ACP5SH_13780 [Syntrophobacteraceae bacterium]